jgi:membrane-associated phospholipid phosphatase
MSSPIRAALLAAVSLVLVVQPGRARGDDLKVDFRVDVPVTLGAAVLAGGLAAPQLSPSRCRVCAPDNFDEDAREILRIRSPALSKDARRTSDAFVSGIMPAGALLASVLGARAQGGPRALAEDLVVVGEAVALAADLNGLTKDLVARERPAATNTAMPGSRNRSFYSGHTSLAFSLAASAATVSTIRGRPEAPWIWGIGTALATGVAYLRVAGDAHWVSDVAVGAVMGGAIGFAVPWLFHRRASTEARRRFDLRPAPGGVALVF